MTIAPQAMSALKALRLPKGFKPAWELVGLFPSQGEWSDEEYLAMAESVEMGRFVELVDGRLEVIPMPTEEHQLINGFLYEELVGFVRPRGLGLVLFSGIRVRLREKNFRVPDVVFLSAVNRTKRGNRFWQGADLAVEVVSEDDPNRDYKEKRSDYAKAGIREYWVVDPSNRTVTLLILKGKRYEKRGVFRDGDVVSSVVLAGFELGVTAIFNSAKV